MTAAETLLRWLVDGSLAASVAVLLVLAMRRPLRRAFGAHVAYAAWALVPLALLATMLPRPQAVQLLAPGLVALHPGILVTAPGEVATGAVAATGIGWMAVLCGLWLLGALVVACRLAGRQRRFVARLGRLQRDAQGHWRGDRVEGPAVVGALRPRIVLPADFELRHAPEEAALVVAHERAHLSRGDTRANLLAVVLRCLHWFNPLLYLAERAFRLDQELACDATVLARHPHARRRYAAAMLNVQLAVPGLPVGCHWQSSQSLKERIQMLKQPQPGALRRRTGILVLGLVLAGSSYAAWAVRPAEMPEAPPAPPAPQLPDAPPAPPAPPPLPAPLDGKAPPPPPPPPAQPTTIAPKPPAPPAPPATHATPAAPAAPATPVMLPPQYPAGAAASGQDGRVMLKLLVGIDGRVKDVVVEQSEPAGVFDAGTVEAARAWVLEPARKDGKPVEGWVRVPVEFKAPGRAASPPGGHQLNWIQLDAAAGNPVREITCDSIVVDESDAGGVHCGVAKAAARPD